VIALTEDYGYRLVYWGWIDARVWPSYGDLNYLNKLRKSSSDFGNTFKKLTSGTDVFLITWFSELGYQPELKDYLLKTYPALDQTDRFWAFDLRYSNSPVVEPK